jgi:hypothetical protein
VGKISNFVIKQNVLLLTVGLISQLYQMAVQVKEKVTVGSESSREVTRQASVCIT